MNTKNTQVDELLKGWRRRQVCEPAHLDGLRRAIMQRARVRRAAAGRRAAVWAPRLAYAAAGAAVAAAVTWTALRGAGNTAAAGLAVLAPGRVRNGAAVFEEMERMFGARLRWICESGGRVGLGLETAQVPSIDGEPVLVRLVLAQRAEGERGWQTAWTTDILTRCQERASVASERCGENRLDVWVLPLSDGRLAVDTRLELDAPVRVGTRSSVVARRGEAVELMAWREADRRYRVYQVVELLGAGRDDAS
jgi:hypothetical protein